MILSSLLFVDCRISCCDFSSRHNETYTWSNPYCCVHNVILGKLWIEQYGKVEIVNYR